jgi:hypothetical protein
MSFKFVRCIAYAITALILQDISAYADVNVIVTFHSRHWQSEIFQHLTANTSCSIHSDFVWRYNPAAISLPTEYGLVKISSNIGEFENFKLCIFEQSKLVKRLDIDKLPTSRTVLSIPNGGNDAYNSCCGYRSSNSGTTKNENCDKNENESSDNNRGRCSNNNQKTENIHNGGFRIIRSIPDEKQSRRNLLSKKAVPQKFIPASIAGNVRYIVLSQFSSHLLNNS